jgi:hypothetical protein
MASDDPVDRFCQEALVGLPPSKWPPGLKGRLPEVLEEAVLEHHDLGYDFGRKAREDPFEATRWACKEGDIGKWMILELATTPLLPQSQRRALVQRLLPWLREHYHHSHFVKYPPYYTGVDFLLRSGDSLKPWFPFLLLRSHAEDVTLAPEMVRRSIDDPEIPPLWTAFLMVRLPLVFDRAGGQKRLPSLRDCADVFFAASLDERIKDLVKGAVGPAHRGRREGVAFPVPPELAREIPAFVRMEGTLRTWNGRKTPDLWATMKVADHDLYPEGEDWLPYAQSLERHKALAMGPKGLARAIRFASDPRKLNALVEPLVKAAQPLAPEVEAALRVQTQAREASVRAAATETLLAYGSDPIGDADRSQRDVAEQVRRSALKIAISQVKMATLPAERRKVLLGYVQAHRDAFAPSPKQSAAISRWIRMVGIAEIASSPDRGRL